MAFTDQSQSQSQSIQSQSDPLNIQTQSFLSIPNHSTSGNQHDSTHNSITLWWTLSMRKPQPQPQPQPTTVQDRCTSKHKKHQYKTKKTKTKNKNKRNQTSCMIKSNDIGIVHATHQEKKWKRQSNKLHSSNSTLRVVNYFLSLPSSAGSSASYCQFLVRLITIARPMARIQSERWNEKKSKEMQWAERCCLKYDFILQASSLHTHLLFQLQSLPPLKTPYQKSRHQKNVVD